MRATFAAALALCTAAPCLAGPLTPPAGPVASSMKTIQQVEPRTPISAATTPGDATASYIITQPGSYYLTGNITGATNKIGIKVAAAHVTIDLCGFALIGGGSGNPAVATQPGAFAFAMHGGTVAGWTTFGLELSAASGCRLRDLTVRNTAGAGAHLGPGTVVESCVFSDNTDNGVSGGPNNVIRATVADNNGGTGIAAGANCVLESCSAEGNGEHGFHIGNASTANSCAAHSNGGSGFSIVDGAQVLDCISSGNASSGFVAGYAVHIARCTATSNTGHGIRFGSFCVIAENLCRANGSGAALAAGIYGIPNTSGSRIERNNCVGNDTGLSVAGTYNIIINNSCGANGLNYEIGANNRAGAVLVPPLTGAINGNSGGPGIGTTDPCANFAF